MMLQILSEMVAILHLGFILFAALGGLLAWRWPRVAWMHLPAVGWAGVVALNGWICPLTRLENFFRQAAGEAGYHGGFIEQWLLPLIYPGLVLSPETTQRLLMVLGAAVLLGNLLLYGWMGWKKGGVGPRPPQA
ncbi:MAG: DUF2784 domain-containing protein [Magnetococcales bacterium]|nr:DUF2784 domain-containing protein [Magnetococcales bacterium]